MRLARTPRAAAHLGAGADGGTDMRITSRIGDRGTPSGPGRHTGVDPAIPRTFIKVSVCVVMVLSIACLYSAVLVSPPLNVAAADSTGADVTLYSEDFEDGLAQDWNLPAGWEVEASSEGHVLHGRGPSYVRYAKDTWGDSSFSARVKLVKGPVLLYYHMTGSGAAAYFVALSESSLTLSKTSIDGTEKVLKSTNWNRRAGRWYQVTIAGTSGRIDIYVDQAIAQTYNDPDPLGYGAIGLEVPRGSECYIDDLRVTAKPEATAGLHWIKTGGPIGGIGYDVRMRMDNPDIMYVTDTFSGVSTSSDGGQTWRASNDGVVTRAGASGDAIPVFCLTIDSRNPDTIWCGTQNSRGIYRSVDGGRTWQERDSGVVEKEGISFRGFAVDPRDSNVVYTAAEISSFAWAGQWLTGKSLDLTKGVVYKTVNGGETWSAIWRGDNLARYVWIDPRNSRTLYVSTGIFDREAANTTGVGVLKSTDGGTTWRVLGREKGLTGLFVGSLFMHPEDPSTLLAGCGNNSFFEGRGAYLTTDGGETWKRTLVTEAPVTSVEFALSNPRIAYAGTAEAIYRSEDGGATWRRLAPDDVYIYGPPGIRAGVPIDFQVDPRNADRLFVNNYGGGNFLSEDGGRTWVVASQGYTGAQLHDIAVSPLDPSTVYTIGRTGPFRSTASGANWEGLNYPPAAFGEWAALEMDPSNPARILISDEHQGVLLLSTTGGSNWTIAFRHPAANPDLGELWKICGFRAIAFAPSNPQVVYAGMARPDSLPPAPCFGVYKSTDEGASWHAANDSVSAGQNVNFISVDPRNADIAYAGTTSSGLLRTPDGGASWSKVSRGLTVLDVRVVAIDPRTPDTLYMGLGGGGVQKSIDGGVNWKNASSGMDPQAIVRAIVIDPTNVATLYAADLRTGVYRSTDGAKTWAKLNEGLRTRAVKALAISSDGKVLYAATEGEGVFRLDVGPAGG